MSDDSDTDDPATGRRGVLGAIVAALATLLAPIRTAARRDDPVADHTTGWRNYDPVKLDIAAHCIESDGRRCYLTYSRDEWEGSPVSNRQSGEGTISYDVYAAYVEVLNDDIEDGVLDIANVTAEGRPVFRVVSHADRLTLGR